MAPPIATDLDDFRSAVRTWCFEHIPKDWESQQTNASDDDFVDFQREWLQTLRRAGFAVPHWPSDHGGGMPISQQIVLYQELAAHNAPRLVVPFVAIHHAAATLFAAGTKEQQRKHLPAILDGEVWVQAFSEPTAGSDLAALKTRAELDGDAYLINGHKVWASGAQYADWCLLLARTDPHAPRRQGISYFLLDMTSTGVDVRPIRQANGESHFCEIFLDDVRIPRTNLVGSENAGWTVAQETLGAERGLTMLELTERLANVGFRRLVEQCVQPDSSGRRLIDDAVVLNGLASLETDISGVRALAVQLVHKHEDRTIQPADASVVKLSYSEILQRFTDFGVEVGALSAQQIRRKSRSGGWESGAWVLDFIGSWEWTIPGGTSEIQRSIIAERGLGLPREPRGAR
ncbi:acyl-CoA dehydrogenase family protein [Gordonia sp. NPDC127522]|uniref:acyl-CoA dehydrogenase family protein n=1 Tax=Gordonia sp. NPDC127522 TaxID=3345390 RepID=UPI00363C7623